MRAPAERSAILVGLACAVAAVATAAAVVSLRSIEEPL